MKQANKNLGGNKSFGFGATQKILDNVIAWAKAAVADGWAWQPIYSNEIQRGKAADLEFGCIRLTREGFIVSMYRRDHKNGLEIGTYAWGPDGLVIRLPDTYDMEAIKAALNVCSSCGNIGETIRVGFAGRVCPACRIILAPKIEFKGWCD